jgi:ABC-type dipeptide/oligopeptide/nickel transport system ATPase subunit
VSRDFVYGPAVRETLPLMLGIAGPSGSGKTFSALRLAVGMQRVAGGDIALIDTEAKRGTAYDRFFKFNHLDFPPPFGPLDYREAVTHVISKGARHVIIDSMTHEHSGPGGVMDQIDKFLDARCGADEKARERMTMLAHKRPKAERKELNNYIIQAGRGGVNFIFCYRADDKVKPVAGKGIQRIGMQPETTSKLVYEMMAMFLLSPSSDGRPIATPGTDLERMLTKLPAQFRDMLTAGAQLSEELGEKFAQWARGKAAAGAPAAVSAPLAATPPAAAPAVVAAATPATADAAADLLAQIEGWTAVGEEKAREGMGVLRVWFESLPPGAAKTRLKAGVMPGLKKMAEEFSS